MNVAAFSDVFENSLRVKVRPDLIIPVASLPGLIVLKLFAWLDRHEGRDVQDIRRLIETYTDAGNVNRLYEEEADELERVGFDIILAGAFLLGKDAQLITDENVRTRLSTSLSGKELRALILQLARSISVLDDRTESAAALLSGFFAEWDSSTSCDARGYITIENKEDKILFNNEVHIDTPLLKSGVPVAMLSRTSSFFLGPLRTIGELPQYSNRNRRKLRCGPADKSVS